VVASGEQAIIIAMQKKNKINITEINHVHTTKYLIHQDQGTNNTKENKIECNLYL